MKRLIVALAVAAGLLIPMTASASTSPRAVAWQMKTLANKNFKFNGSAIRVATMVCQSRGGSLYVCRATFNAAGYGLKMYWPTVTYSNGNLKASGGVTS